MDSYVVRIYRKEEDDPRRLLGIVEKVGIGEKKIFSNLNELWSILNPVKKEPVKQRKSRSSRRNPNGMSL